MNVVTEHKKYIEVDPEKAGELAQRLHIKKDEIPYVKKYYTRDKQDVDKKERSVVSYISTGARDRDGEVLLPEGVVLDNYRKNPIVLWGHDYRSMPVGKNIWIKQDEKGLVAKTVFANSERGEEMFNAYAEDLDSTGPLLKGWSVGFIPLDYEDIEVKGEKGKTDTVRTYKKWELLEYSAVPIPSCPEALTLAVEKGIIKSEGMKKDLEIEIEVEDKEIEVVSEVSEPGSDKGVEVVEVNRDWNPLARATEEKVEEIKEAVLAHETKPGATEGAKTIGDMTEEIIDYAQQFKTKEGNIAMTPEMFESVTHELLSLREDVTEIKEGRVLSSKNRTLVKAIMDELTKLRDMLEELYSATEPPAREEETSRGVEVVVAEKDIPPQNLEGRIATALENLKDSGKLSQMVDEAINLSVSKKLGKVEQ